MCLIFPPHSAHIHGGNKKLPTKFDVFLFWLNFYFILDGLGGGVHFKTFPLLAPFFSILDAHQIETNRNDLPPETCHQRPWKSFPAGSFLFLDFFFMSFMLFLMMDMCGTRFYLHMLSLIFSVVVLMFCLLFSKHFAGALLSLSLSPCLRFDLFAQMAGFCLLFILDCFILWPALRLYFLFFGWSRYPNSGRVMVLSYPSNGAFFIWLCVVSFTFLDSAYISDIYSWITYAIWFVF